MNSFHYRKIIPSFVIGVIASIIAGIILLYLPKGDQTTELIKLLRYPIPIVSIFFFALAILLVTMVILFKQTRTHKKEIDLANEQALKHVKQAETKCSELEIALTAARRELNPILNLIRRLAFIIADRPSYNSIQRDEVIKKARAVEGNIATEKEIEEALGMMLDKGIIYRDSTSLSLSQDWQKKLKDFE